MRSQAASGIKNPALSGVFMIFENGPSLVRNNTHELAVLRPLLFEFHVAVALRIKRVVSADANIRAGMYACSTLADNDVAGNHFFATEQLDAQSFGF